MLSYHKLMEKITEAYDHALNNRVDEFRAIDEEVTSLVPHYIQQITYASQAVVKLNNVQLSNLFTQVLKIILTLGGFFLFMLGLSTITFIEGGMGAFLIGAIGSIALYYVWTKIPTVRLLWSSTKEVDNHSTMLYVSLSECVKSLSEIKGFQQSTFSTVQEWQRQGLWNEKEPSEEEIEEATKSVDAFLQELKNRDHYKD